ncbi:MAG: DUF1329 domain-containing protein [Gammaproteobacteria bacterium]|nr:DUF1329 domain-containing protein [Gammaproteobacteria bacterium]
MKVLNKLMTTAALAGLVLTISSAQASEPPPGTMITAENVDQYLEYLAPSTAIQIKQGLILKVFEKTPVEKLVYPKWLEMTNNPPQGPAVMLDEAGTWGLADGSYWPGGFPFPDPQNGREVMANFQYHLTADDADASTPGAKEGLFLLINEKSKIYKRQVINLAQTRMTGRVFNEPLGAYKGYEHELYRTNTLFFEPYDVRGLVSINVIYRDQAKLPDGYVYVPVLRRVRRQSGAQRADSVGGGDLTLGDVDTFSDPLGMWDFKILETKKLLSGQNHATGAKDYYDGKTELIAGRYPTPYFTVELRDTYVIEAIPRYETIYSKKILRVDTETFRPSTGEFFDRQGEMLKSYSLNWNIPEDFTPSPDWIIIQNMQTNNQSLFAIFDFKGNAKTPLRRMLTSSMKDFGR